MEKFININRIVSTGFSKKVACLEAGELNCEERSKQYKDFTYHVIVQIKLSKHLFRCNSFDFAQLHCFTCVATDL